MEINRDVLLAYLNDLKIAETVIDVYYDEKIHKMNQLEERKKFTVFNEKPPVNPEIEHQERIDYAYVSFLNFKKEKKKQLFFGIGFIFFIFFVLGCFALLLGLMHLLFDGLHFRFKDTLYVLFCLPFIILLKRTKSEINSAEKKYLETFQDTVSDFEMELYQEELDDYEKRKSKKRTELENINKKICNLPVEYDSEIDKWKQIRDDLYGMNIIPLQFRDIEGVYYLYDYLSTSNESLTSALTQANLDTIKKNLEQVISLQGKTIIQQAQANQILFQQNQQIIDHARSIESNTELSAKYSRISAINSEISLKLQSEQLAYQKADFWL